MIPQIDERIICIVGEFLRGDAIQLADGLGLPDCAEGCYHSRMILNINNAVRGQENMLVVSEKRDPVIVAKARAQRERYDRNWDWLQAHASEVYCHRGKMICVAGANELFVGDSVAEVLEKAKAAYPEDDAPLTRYVPLERGPRIYAL